MGPTRSHRQLHRVCPLCLLGGKLTSEDINPMWIRRQLIGSAEQAPPRLTIRICQSCNAAMGRALEDPVSRLMRGVIADNPREFSSEDQHVLARWIVKTTMLHHLAVQARQDSMLAPVVRNLVLRSVQGGPLPEGVSIRACRVAVGDTDGLVANRDLTIHARPLVGMYAVSWIGAFGFEFLLGDPKTLRDYEAEVDAKYETFARLWPLTRHEVALPPPEPHHPEELMRLRAAWAERTPSWEPPPFEYAVDLRRE